MPDPILVSALPADTAPAADDLLVMHDVDAARTESVTVANLAASAAFSGQYVAQSLADAKGDILVATADDTVTRLAVGSDAQVLTADSAEASGVKWATVAAAATGAPRAALYLPASTAGNYVSTPDAADLNATTELELVVRVALDDWTPSAAGQALISKWTTGQESFLFMVQTFSAATQPRLFINTGSLVNVASSVGMTAPDAGAPLWMRVIWQSSSGLVRFYYAADQDDEPVSWTQIGSDLSLGTGGTMTTKTSPVEMGGVNLHGSYTNTGISVMRGIMRTTVSGSNVANYDASMPAARYYDSAGKLWTVTGTANGFTPAPL